MGNNGQKCWEQPDRSDPEKPRLQPEVLVLTLDGKEICGEFRIRRSETGNPLPLQKQVGEGGQPGLRRVGAKRQQEVAARNRQ